MEKHMNARWIYKELLLSAIVIWAVWGSHAEACNQIYAKVGTGYKFDEETRFDVEGTLYERRHVDPYSARIEVGCRKGSWTYGLSHHSQWRTGWPINKNGEPYKTEIFIDYEWTWDIGG